MRLKYTKVMEVGNVATTIPQAVPEANNLIGDIFLYLGLFILWILIVIVSIFVLRKVINKLLFHEHLKTHSKKQEKAFLQIKIHPNNEQKENSMEEFLISLHRVLPQGAIFSLETVSVEQFLKFYIVINSSLKNVVESQLYAQFPEAEIEETEDYLPEEEKNVAAVELNFKKLSFYPLNTYKNLQEDLLKSLSAILSKTEPGEKVFFQLALKRVGGKLHERDLSNAYYKWFGPKSSAEEEQINPAYLKASSDLFYGKLRIGYSAQSKTVAESKINTLIGLFKSLKSVHNELKKKKLSFSGTTFKSFHARVTEGGHYFTPAELATLFHLPYKGNVVSNVVNTTSKRAPAPDVLPTLNNTPSSEISIFGETNYRNERKVFGVKRVDRRRHLYVVGKTGSGKSRLLQLLIISDILSGKGCCLIDPHGDLANELLMFVPKERIKDVVYVNPTDKDFPIGFNPLEPVTDYELRQHLSTFFISIFRKQLQANWNPRMEHLVRYLTLALLETPDSNVLGIPRMLSDTAFRQRVTMQIQDPVVKAFWTSEFSTSNEQFSREAVVPLLNKIGQFTANPVVRNMIGQRKNALNFSKFMDEGKIVLINISKGKLGDENSALLGSMFITKIQQAALSRANQKEEDRKDFYFYVDEFQNFATEAFSSILSEARKYHLNLTIAHQYIAQLPEEVKATAFGNVGSIIVFPVGGDDANYLAREFVPVFIPEDMVNLNIREMYIKLSIDGKATPPFSGRTVDVPKPQQDFSEEILNHSRMTYGKNRVSVENEIKQWSEVADASQLPGNSEDKFPEPVV